MGFYNRKGETALKIKIELMLNLDIFQPKNIFDILL